MFSRFKSTYIIAILIVLCASCDLTRYVPEGKYLLESNTIQVNGDEMSNYELSATLRQQSNYKTAGIRLKLRVYNAIDTIKVKEKRDTLNRKNIEKNKRIIKKQQATNQKRIDRARQKGKDYYTEKLVDTIIPKRFLREWMQYKLGEKPVVFDSSLFVKSLDQLNIYLKNRGYYFGTVTGKVNYLPKRRVSLEFQITTGKRFYIDTVFLSPNDNVVGPKFRGYLIINPLRGQPFDQDMLDNSRNEIAKFLRSNEIYGIGSSNFTILADTNVRDMKVSLVYKLSDRQVVSKENLDSIITVKHLPAEIGEVYFHISDTTFFGNRFSDTINKLGIPMMENQFFTTLDTLHYNILKDKKTGKIDVLSNTIFLYNGKLDINPDILERNVYLESTNKYKEEYLERSYDQLVQLGLFKVIKIDLKDVKSDTPGKNKLDVHYYLIPAAKQSFSFEPRATNSNGFLGVSSSIKYLNKNIFHGAQRLELSLSGGFESQPPIFAETIDGEKIKQAGRSFNTFEFGPSIKLDLPGLFPVKKNATSSKRIKPRTEISTAYNLQVRTDFSRQLFQLNYLWKFLSPDKTQTFQLGVPGLSVIKFVNIDNSEAFQNKLEILNDLFLKNAYSDQFIWQDLKFSFEYNNQKEQLANKNLILYYNGSFDPSGNIVSMFKKYQDTVSGGQHSIFGVGYSQFLRLDNNFSAGVKIDEKSWVYSRVQAGLGVPYGNTKTTLPYDYSFFAGGANDNRGWRARALGPGSYKYYLDTNRTATQIGDIRLGSSVEFRYSLGSTLKGAAFIDAGNVWTFKNDINREGSQFSKNWYKEIALSAGIGARMDFGFFILRFDLGIPLTNPALPEGERWIFQKDRPKFKQQVLDAFGPNYAEVVPKLFIPVVQFGIGYPF
jgi:outer membrane protein insertion porin family